VGITTKSSMKIKAGIERLRFMAINDKVKELYPLAKLWFTDISADIIQNHTQSIGTDKDINAIIGNIQCELDQPLISDPSKYEPFMYFFLV